MPEAKGNTSNRGAGHRSIGAALVSPSTIALRSKPK
jgi:hypothetical protein